MRTYKETQGEDADGKRGEELVLLDISEEEIDELVVKYLHKHGYLPKELVVECDGHEFVVPAVY